MWSRRQGHNVPHQWTEELQHLEGGEADLLRAGGHQEAVPVILRQTSEDPITKLKLVVGLEYHCHSLSEISHKTERLIIWK